MLEVCWKYFRIMDRSKALFLSSFTSQEVCTFLKTEIPMLSEGVLTIIVNHKIDGEAFLALNEEYLREIAPFLGDRIKLKKRISAQGFSAAAFSTVSCPPSRPPACMRHHHACVIILLYHVVYQVYNQTASSRGITVNHILHEFIFACSG